MSWLVVNKDGSEYIFNKRPDRVVCIDDVECLFDRSLDRYYPYWNNLTAACEADHWRVQVPKGTALLLTGRQLTFDDDPVNLDDTLIQERLRQCGLK